MDKTFRASKKIVSFLFALALSIICITYSNHFYNDFHFDDSHVVQNNIYIRNLKNIPQFFKDAKLISSLPGNQQYRPLVATTLALDYAIEKDIHHPFWFHFSMFSWFLVQCVFLFFFFLSVANNAITNPWNVFFALFSMTLYGVHTANAETINYISARSDSMSTCWVIITFMTFIKWPHLRQWGLYLIPWIIACLFKQTAIVLPALIFLYVLFFEKQQGLDALFRPTLAKETWVGLLKSTGVLWAFGIFLLFFLKSMDPASYSPGGTSVYHYLITQPFVMVHYFLTFFLPLQLSMDTDWTTLTRIIDDRFFIGILFIVSALVAVFLTSKKQHTRPIAFGLLWFFIALLPTSSVIPLAEVMNDHRLFFPLIGLVITFSFTGYLLLINRFQKGTQNNSIYFQCIIILLWVILGAFSYGTYQRNKVWLTEESLWKDVTIKSPKNGRGLMSYGLTLMSKGELNEAKKYFLEAEKLTPHYHILMINLGVVHNALNLEKEADAYFEKAIQSGPNIPSVYSFYAQHYRMRRPDLSEQALIKALSLSSGDIEVRHQLMYLYWEQENWDKLKLVTEDTLHLMNDDPLSLEYQSHAEKKLTLIDVSLQQSHSKPTIEHLLSLSSNFFQERHYIGSIKAAERAIHLNPELVVAYNNICAGYNKLHHYEKAEEACRKALALDPNFEIAQNNLADSMDGQRG